MLPVKGLHQSEASLQAWAWCRSTPPKIMNKLCVFKNTRSIYVFLTLLHKSSFQTETKFWFSCRVGGDPTCHIRRDFRVNFGSKDLLNVKKMLLLMENDGLYKSRVKATWVKGALVLSGVMFLAWCTFHLLKEPFYNNRGAACPTSLALVAPAGA